MSEDSERLSLAAPPSVWARQIAAELGISADLPGDVIIVAAAKAANDPAGPRGPALEELAEDVRSFTESCAYFIRRGERGEAIRCECCGTLVALTPEALGVHGSWKPGSWEHETFRRHTLRRCEWKRENPTGGLDT